MTIERIKELEEQLHIANVELENALYMTTAQRLACQLQKLACNDKLHISEFRLPVTKTVIALRLGIYNETMSRTIPKLKNHGLKIVKNKVVIFNPEQVKRSVCNNCAGKDSCKAYKYIHENNKIGNSN